MAIHAARKTLLPTIAAAHHARPAVASAGADGTSRQDIGRAVDAAWGESANASGPLPRKTIEVEAWPG